MSSDSYYEENPSPAKSQPETSDLIQTVAKVEELVVMLCEEPKHKPELARELDVSKSTVYNWATDLIDYDVVERTDEGYVLTPLGRQLFELYCDMNRVFARLYDAKPLLQALPRDHHPPFSVLDDAEIVDTSHNPYGPFEAFSEWVKDANHVIGFPAIPSTEKLETLARDLRANEVSMDVVLETSDVELMKSRVPDVVGAIQRNGRLYETDREIPIRLYVAEDLAPQVGVTTLTSDGHVSMFAQLSGDEAVEWALELYEEYRSDATRIETSR